MLLSDKEKVIIVLGRGHGGTRLVSKVLSSSGVYMGCTNVSGDMIPAEPMYEAVRLAGLHARCIPQDQEQPQCAENELRGDRTWDFTDLLTIPVPNTFEAHVQKYIENLSQSSCKIVGWKLPETLLALPWIIRLFPNAYFIHWTRNPWDSISGIHITDYLPDFGVPYAPPETLHALSSEKKLYQTRLDSWLYQRQIVAATIAASSPKHFIQISYEDFVSNQLKTLELLSEFLNHHLMPVPLHNCKPPKFIWSAVPTTSLTTYGYSHVYSHNCSNSLFQVMPAKQHTEKQQTEEHHPEEQHTEEQSEEYMNILL